MIDAFFSALSGMRTASRRLQVSANNTANLQTPGFKKSSTVISDNRLGGARVSGTLRSNAPGAILTTNDPLNIAIQGNGFFQVGQPGGGTAFSRSGVFQTDDTGRVVNANGNPLQPEITVPVNIESVGITASGQVTGFANGQNITLGQIQLAGFNNPGGLTPLGNNEFGQSAQSGQPVVGNPGSGGLGLLIPGALETSNVDIAEEAINQIVAKTAFKANANVVRTADEMTGTLLNIKA